MHSLMKFLGFLFIALWLPTTQAEPYQYKIHAGDILDVSVWKEEGMLRELRVLPDGSISFPLVGVIVVAGKTVNDVQLELTEKISETIPDPTVNVSVKLAEGNFVYVIGQVKKPGHFLMYQPMDVMQVLSLAGGLTPFAKSNDILILRRKNGISDSIPFRYGDIEDGESLKENHLLKTGDVIVVP
ncbi:MAG: polysaccharide biosynthesis/export family protein [Methylococcales bacterium]|nr:polysaccharide biosynthesis/export family protein [Methylococcales bacterium]